MSKVIINNAFHAPLHILLVAADIAVNLLAPPLWVHAMLLKIELEHRNASNYFNIKYMVRSEELSVCG